MTDVIATIISGIRFHAAEVEKEDKKNNETLTKAEYAEANTHDVSTDTGKFVFKDYAPHVFRHIREDLYGITKKQYLKSWAESEEKREMVNSTGRSGSLFFRTDDKRFFFKTILHPEVGVMMSILEDYVAVCPCQPSKQTYLKHLHTGESMIMNIVGLHRATVDGNHIWVMVMASVFPPGVRIDTIYDLKGRKPKKGKSFVDRGRKTLDADPTKDNELNYGIMFKEQADEDDYISRLTKDVHFLQQHDLMDYSLLIGIHRTKNDVVDESESDKKKKKKSKKSSDKKEKQITDKQALLDLGGKLGTDPETKEEVIYFIGIIDCLTKYVFKKKFASVLKQMLWDKSELSTVPSKLYGDRFLYFMVNKLVGPNQVEYKGLENIEKAIKSDLKKKTANTNGVDNGNGHDSQQSESESKTDTANGVSHSESEVEKKSKDKKPKAEPIKEEDEEEPVEEKKSSKKKAVVEEPKEEPVEEKPKDKSSKKKSEKVSPVEEPKEASEEQPKQEKKESSKKKSSKKDAVEETPKEEPVEEKPKDKSSKKKSEKAKEESGESAPVKDKKSDKKKETDSEKFYTPNQSEDDS